MVHNSVIQKGLSDWGFTVLESMLVSFYSILRPVFVIGMFIGTKHKDFIAKLRVLELFGDASFQQLLGFISGSPTY